ncbi:MAG: hypothetical protein ACYSSL_09680 [Planctomycetota bacterium]
MDRILLIPVFLPLVAGFVFLFLPNKTRELLKALTLIILAVVFAISIKIFNLGQLNYSWSLFKVDNINLELLLGAKPLGAFMLMFAAGFGLLIALYSLKSAAKTKSLNVYYGAILLTVGGSAGILLSDHLLLLLIFWEIVTASLYLLIATG